MRTKTKHACLVALCVVQGCLPGRWHPAGGDAGSDAALDAVIDAGGDAAFDAPPIDTAPVDVATDATALDAIDVLDAPPVDAPADARPDVLRPDAPADVATDAGPPDVRVAAVTAVFSRTADLCATSDTPAAVELQLARDPDDTREVVVALAVTPATFAVSPASVRFGATTAPTTVRVTPMASATGAFTLTATPEGATPTALRGALTPSIPGTPDCSIGPRGYAEVLHGDGYPEHNWVVSLDLMTWNGEQMIVTLGMSEGSHINWYADVSADWAFRRLTNAGLPDRTFGAERTGLIRIDTSNYRPGLGLGQERADRVRVGTYGTESIITGVGYGRQNIGGDTRGQLAVARLRASGDRDDRFHEPSGVRLLAVSDGSNHELTSVVPLSDGSVLTSGFIGVVGADDRFTLERISPLGVRLRATTTTAAPTTDPPRELLIAPAGRRARRGNIALDGTRRIVIAGALVSEPVPALPAPVGYVARLTTAGVLDPAFNARGTPGLLVINLAGVTIDGQPVTEVFFTDVGVLRDGAYVAAGTARTASRSRPVLVRVSAEGELTNWAATSSPVLLGDCAGAPNGGYEALAVRSSDGAIVAAGACREEDIVGEDSRPGTNTLVSCVQPNGGPCVGFGAPDRPGTYIEDLSACGPDPSSSCFDAAFDVRFDARGRVIAAITALRGAPGFVFDGTNMGDLVRTGGVLRLFAPARIP